MILVGAYHVSGTFTIIWCYLTNLFIQVNLWVRFIIYAKTPKFEWEITSPYVFSMVRKICRSIGSEMINYSTHWLPPSIGDTEPDLSERTFTRRWWVSFSSIDLPISIIVSYVRVDIRSLHSIVLLCHSLSPRPITHPSIPPSHKGDAWGSLQVHQSLVFLHRLAPYTWIALLGHWLFAFLPCGTVGRGGRWHLVTYKIFTSASESDATYSYIS